jgi:hypothetical protein
VVKGVHDRIQAPRPHGAEIAVQPAPVIGALDLFDTVPGNAAAKARQPVSDQPVKVLAIALRMFGGFENVPIGAEDEGSLKPRQVLENLGSDRGLIGIENGKSPRAPQMSRDLGQPLRPLQIW